MQSTSLATQNKKCDLCGLFLSVSHFYRNKAKKDGLQNRCKDCILDQKMRSKLGIQVNAPRLEREIYFIPDIYIVGVGRTQTYQHCCLCCESAFFCMEVIKEKTDLYCENCDCDDTELAERNTSKTNYIGNVVGWMAKVESPSRRRTQKNYKKCYQRDQYTCQYCGYNMQNAKVFHPLHIDHIRPWSAQGGNSLTNLVVACQPCNNLVSDKVFSNFGEKKEYIIFERQRKQWKYERKQGKKETA